MKRWLFAVLILVLAFGATTSAWAIEDSTSPTAMPAQEALELTALYEKVSSSVVFIEVRNTDSDFFFATGGLGSGFVYDQNGYIITNNHVVEGATRIDVTFFDGTLARAEVIGVDVDSDIAVIQVQDVSADRLHPVELGDSSQLRVGEDVVAIGNPFGQNWTMTRGIISAVGRTNQAQSGFSMASMVQTDAAINPGNSGGPLIDRFGQVIGMTTLIYSDDRVSSGVGFAVPVNTIKRVAPVLIEHGEYEYTWIGISGGDLNLDVIDLLGLEHDTRGVLISRVTSEGPAQKAGFRGSNDTRTLNGLNYQVGGDIITAIDGTPIVGIDSLVGYLAEYTVPGDEVLVTLIRDGETVEISVTLEARPDLSR